MADINHTSSNNWLRFFDDEKWGYKDIVSDQVVIPAKFDFLGFFYKGLTEACINFQWGVIDENGEAIIPFIYQEVKIFNNGLVAVRKNNLWGLVNTNGAEIIPIAYESVSNFNSNNQSIISQDKKYGVVDSLGRLIIPCIYDKIEYEGNIGYYLITNGERTEPYSSSGEKIPLKHYDKRGMNIGFYYYNVCLNGRWGVADNNGVETIPCIYSSPLRHIGLGNKDDDQLIPANLFDKWGYIDLNGVIKIPFIFDDAECFSSGLGAVKIDGKWGFIKTSGEWAIQPQFDNAGFGFKYGFAIIKQNAKWGVIDENGMVVVPFIHDNNCIQISNLDINNSNIRSGACVELTINNKKGLLSRDGRLLIPVLFDEVKIISSGIAPVKKNKLWGFYDILEGMILPCEYDYVWSNFVNDYAIVSKNKKCYAINKIGNIIIEGDSIFRTSNNTFLVKHDGMFGMVNSRGEILVPFKYNGSSISTIGGPPKFGRGTFFLKKGDYWGIIDKEGKLLSPPLFSLSDYKSIFNNNSPCYFSGIARVKKGSMEGFVDTWGNFVVDCFWKKNVYEPAIKKMNQTSKMRLYRVNFTDWNGIRKYFTTYASSEEAAISNWEDSGIQFGAHIDSIE